MFVEPFVKSMLSAEELFRSECGSHNIKKNMEVRACNIHDLGRPGMYPVDITYWLLVIVKCRNKIAVFRDGILDYIICPPYNEIGSSAMNLLKKDLIEMSVPTVRDIDKYKKLGFNIKNIYGSKN